MKIKRIDICGFKSFVDRTSISFPDPITAIVGPNGCGKSNIVDAIRWVMGEQSAKHLRGRAMEDVIFAGSETRGPHGFAEVSLTFDAHAMAPDAEAGGVSWGAAGPAEVVVTRRLYRDGESEYLLNGVPSRLRDVVEFFLGTGVGSKAYAIIEQGRIGFIVSSRAEERRGLIDEAAGITKYKAKKKAAERRMDSARQNLLRVGDIIGEIETRLRTLRLQAQKAERYKRYKAELRDIDLWSASQRYLGLLAEEKSLRAQAEEMGAEHEGAQRAVMAEETAVEAERLGVDEERRELEAAQGKMHALTYKAGLASERARHYDDEATSLGTRADDARREIAGLEAKAAAHAASLGDLDAALVSLDDEAAARHRAFEARQDTHDRVRADLGTAREALDRWAAELADFKARIARGESDLGAAETRRADLATRLDAVVAEVGGCTERIAVLEAEAAGLRGRLGELHVRRGDIAAQRALAERRLGGLRDEAERGELELETLREEAHRRRSRLASLTEIQDRYESFQRGVRAIMAQRQSTAASGIKGVVADIVRPPPDLEMAVEAVLGERLGNIIVESHEVGVEAIEFLKSRSEGRSSFIPLFLRDKPQVRRAAAAGGLAALSPSNSSLAATDGGGMTAHSEIAAAQGGGVTIFDAGVDVGSVWPSGDGVKGPMLELIGYDRAYDKIAAHLLGDVLVVEDLRRALELWRETHTDKTIVTLEGDVIDPHGVVTGGSRESAVSGVLGQKREIRELSEVVTKLEADYRAALERHVTVKQKLGEVTRTLEDLAATGRDDDLGLVAQQKDLDRAQDDLARLRQRRQELGAQGEALSADLAAIDRRRAGTASALDADRRAVETGERAVGELRAQTLSLGDRLDALIAELTELRIAASQADDRRAAARDTQARLAHERQEADARTERLRITIAEDGERAETLREDAGRLRDEAALANAEVEARARVHGERQSALEARSGELARREAELRAARGATADLERALGTVRMKQREAEIKRSGLEEQVAERYPDVSLPRIVSDYHMRAPVGSEEEKRQGELRGLIERMGEINLAAIEETDEAQKRFDFLTAQKADLESAISQLETAIERINRASRKRFRETFEAVNAQFQEVFPRLFGGGKAHLALTDPGDLLETGVEIAANPPGKKVMQNIELLSGGEKALTAVSLLFAIFLVKPSPFCVLDEVDAPLDDANVGRFNDHVREMTGRSQFIIITHNRRTMEIADALVGITMEEPGVSKLVKVNLRGVKRAA